MTETTTFIALGTAGGPVPKLHRSPPAHAVVSGDDTILVDCGEGAFQQLKRAGIDLQNVHHIILSHHHFDHIGSLFAGLGLNMMLHRQQTLHIYGPPGTQQIIEGLLTACDVPHATGFGTKGGSLTHPREFVAVHEITPKDVFTIGRIQISCCENTHYRPEEEFGQDGPLSLSLRFDAPDRSIVFTGDTGPCQGLVEFASGAQLLVGELIDIEIVMERIVARNPDAPNARLAAMRHHMEAHHLTAEQLGEMARQTGVEHVVAVHIGFDSLNAEAKPAYTAKIASRYAGHVTIAEDLDRF